MNEQLQNRLAEILTSIQNSVGAVGDFTLSQLQDIAPSYITFGRVWLSCLVLILLAGLYFSTSHAIKISKKILAKEIDEVYFLFVLLIGAAASGFLIGLIDTSHDLLLVWVAPKVWMLKELSGVN